MSQRVAPIKNLMRNARAMKWGLSLWPPFLFAGIHVTAASADLRRATVRLRKNPLTSNFFGTQYGASIFSMTDPFWAIMVHRALGDGYIVWDQAAEIDFIKPGRTALTAEFVLTDDAIAELIEAAAGGDKVLRWFEVPVLDTSGATIATVRKQIYVRRKR